MISSSVVILIKYRFRHFQLSIIGDLLSVNITIHSQSKSLFYLHCLLVANISLITEAYRFLLLSSRLGVCCSQIKSWPKFRFDLSHGCAFSSSLTHRGPCQMAGYFASFVLCESACQNPKDKTSEKDSYYSTLYCKLLHSGERVRFYTLYKQTNERILATCGL